MSWEPQDPRIGTVLEGRYKILQRIAVGAMGVVYRAQRVKLGRPVAIKFLLSSVARDKEFRERFAIEARAMSQLSHPHCISVIDFGVTDAPYIVMDLVPGHTLKELAKRAPIDSGRALPIVRQLLAALAHAHNKGIIHRDVKPANIMLTEVTGTGDHVRVFDFGLAKILGHERIRAADSDLVVGTPSYMSPEHLRDEELDARADIFSAGVVLYELLTGTKPFKARKPTDILSMHKQTPPLLRKALKTTYFSDELQDAVAKALAIERSERFQTAAEFATALDLVPEATRPSVGFTPAVPPAATELADPAPPPPPSALARTAESLRAWWPKAALGFALLALAVGLWFAI